MATAMSIGDRLADLREEAGLSQTQFAERTGTSQSAFAAYERGVREPPVSLICEACKAFDVSPAWLLFGEGTRRTADASELAARAYSVTRDFVCKTSIKWTDELESELFALAFRYLNEHTNASDEFLTYIFERAIHVRK